MKILSFQCKEIHGYLSFSLSFNEDLTFLTGINGSGKTSAVRAITAVLTPSFRDLAALDYNELVVVIDDGSTTSIAARKSEEEILLTCSDVNETLRIPILPSDAYEPRGRFSERERDFYREQEAINAKHAVLARIERIPTPMFLDLERRNQLGTRQRSEGQMVLYSRATPVNPLAGTLFESLRDAQSLAEDTFRRFLAKRAQLTDDLNGVVPRAETNS
jgi:predicted ATP-dependent endonuclease of OLD family